MENKEKNIKEEKKQKTKKKSKKIWIILILLLIIICAVGVSIFIFIQQQNNENTPDENSEVVEKEKIGIGYISSLDIDDIIELKDNSCKIVDAELLVTFNEDTSSAEAEEIIEKYDGEVVGELYFLNQYQVKFEEAGEDALKAKKEELKTETNVENVIYNYVNENKLDYDKKVGGIAGGEVKFDKDYHISALGIDEAYEKVENKEKINVGIIDTPIYYAHEDLSIDKDNIHFLSSSDFKTIDDVLAYYATYDHEADTENKNNTHSLLGGCNYLSIRSHGTHVAGIISAKHNGIGIDGVNDNVNLHYANSWYYLKTDSADGHLGHAGTTFSLAYALSTLIMSDTKVINMSIGEYLLNSTNGIDEENEVYKEHKDYYDKFFEKIKSTNKDFLIVKSAGNDSTDKELDIITKVFKSNEFVNNHMIVVGAAKKPFTVDLDDGGIAGILNFSYKKSTYSNYGDYVDIFALGNIYSTIYDNDYYWMEGTSQATPIVSGIASLVYQANPNLVASQVKEILIGSANDYVSCNGKPVGVVNAINAVNNAINYDGQIQEKQKEEIGLIRGIVENSKNEIVLENVLIYFKNTETNETTYTDIEEGNYEAFLPNGTYDIEARVNDDVRFKKKNVEINSSEPTICNITLSDETLDDPEDAEIDDTKPDENEGGSDNENSNNNSNSTISRRYEIISERNLTWEEAKQKCEEAGGHLVTITSQEEMDYIYETLDIGNGRYWIGAYRDDDSNWMWVTGEEWDYTNWNEGEPNDSSNVKSNENRAVTWSQGKWNDLNEENTSEQYGYICEWD